MQRNAGARDAKYCRLDDKNAPATSVGVPGRRLVNLRTGGKTGKVRKTTTRSLADDELEVGLVGKDC